MWRQLTASKKINVLCCLQMVCKIVHAWKQKINYLLHFFYETLSSSLMKNFVKATRPQPATTNQGMHFCLVYWIKFFSLRVYFLGFSKVVTFFGLLAALKESCLQANSYQDHILQKRVTMINLYLTLVYRS